MKIKVVSFKNLETGNHRERDSLLENGIPATASSRLAKRTINRTFVRCLAFSILALGQAAWAGVTAYNDFGKPSLQNQPVSHIGVTSVELKSGNGTVVKTGELIDYTNGQLTDINMKLSVSGAPLGQTEIGRDAPKGTVAGDVFAGKVNCEGGTPLPAGKVHFIDLTGLDPTKRYELAVFASIPTETRATPVVFTLWDVASFENKSVPASGHVAISGQLNRTTQIETAGNDQPTRGKLCHYKSIRSGPDGDLRVILQTPNGGQLNSLMLREQTPPVLAGNPTIELGEDNAVIRAKLADSANGPVKLRWRAVSDAIWQSMALSPGAGDAIVARLESLPTFVEHEIVFTQATTQGDITTEPRRIRPQKNGIIYSTSFEPTEPVAFLPGAITTKTGPWRVAKGSAEVQTGRVAHGGQAVRTGDCIIEMTLKNPSQVLWADAFIQDPGISQARQIPDVKASSVLLFHDGKLLALDGNGSGGGRFVTAAELSGDRFTRLTIRTDYGAKQFDVWVDGKPVLAKLGFKNDSVTQFHGAKRLAGSNSYLDDFSLSTWGLDRDSDGDGLNDLDEAKFYNSYPLLADSDRDGASDAHELSAGTHPADPQSIFTVKIDASPDGKTRLTIPTITGLEYTLQRRAALGQGDWKSLPGFENVPGNDQVQSFLETPDGRNYFYRGVIVNRLNPATP